MKTTTQQPLTLKWTGPIDNSGKFHQLKWVKRGFCAHDKYKNLMTWPRSQPGCLKDADEHIR